MNNGSLKLSDSKFVRNFRSFVLLQGRKVGFYGNFGHGDLGDDASFYVARQLLGEHILPFSKRSYAFNPRVLKALMIGGGGILRWECPYIPRRLLGKKTWNFPVALYSAGINCDYGKEFSQESKDQIQQLCEICDYIGVRDLETQRFINALGFKDVNIVPDLELLLQEQPGEFDYEKKGFTIGVVLSPHSEFSDTTVNNIISTFAEFINHTHENGNQVLILPFDSPHADSKREAHIIGEILKKVKDKNKIGVLEGEISPGEMLYAIKEFCDVMVCMRLHSAVFAANAGIPFMCVSFNKMHRAFLEMLEILHLDVSLREEFSFENIKNTLDSLLDNYIQLKEQIEKKTLQMQTTIKASAAELNTIINKSQVNK